MTRALWDSGSQVTIIDEKWRRENLPNVVPRDINEILEADNSLDITAANPIWTRVPFQIIGQSQTFPFSLRF